MGTNGDASLIADPTSWSDSLYTPVFIFSGLNYEPVKGQGWDTASRASYTPSPSPTF